MEGYFTNLAILQADNGLYKAGCGRYNNISIHPSSIVYGIKDGNKMAYPNFIVFDELQFTTKPYARNVTTIETSSLNNFRDRIHNYFGETKFEQIDRTK